MAGGRGRGRGRAAGAFAQWALGGSLRTTGRRSPGRPPARPTTRSSAEAPEQRQAREGKAASLKQQPCRAGRPSQQSPASPARWRKLFPNARTEGGPPTPRLQHVTPGNRKPRERPHAVGGPRGCPELKWPKNAVLVLSERHLLGAPGGVSGGAQETRSPEGGATLTNGGGGSPGLGPLTSGLAPRDAPRPTPPRQPASSGPGAALIPSSGLGRRRRQFKAPRTPEEPVQAGLLEAVSIPGPGTTRLGQLCGGSKGVARSLSRIPQAAA
ncbi:translation initiation factor IF-2-like [Monodelphis domestica]|uniref:translation initiation factor IF-2-like n=1 Tax=Monodelphis domestica TaxID=13616 RepID=UPI0024E2378A|nr:translation initiation factor IF-2-like [Monodelphis domestica]